MPVCIGGRYDDFAVARELDFVRLGGFVGESDSSCFCGSFRRDENLHLRFDVAVATLEDRAIRIERYPIRVGRSA